MPSPKTSNGSLKPIGTSNEPANASKRVILMLPSFTSPKSPHARPARRDAHLAAGGGWRQEPSCQERECRRRVAALAKAHARRRALGKLLVTAFIALAAGMSAYALHREAQLLEQEQKAEARQWL